MFPEDFDIIGSSVAVQLVLHWLAKERVISSVAQGIYVRPVIKKYIAPVIPSAEEAKAIAKRDKIRIMPTGVYALDALGIGTQLSMENCTAYRWVGICINH